MVDGSEKFGKNTYHLKLHYVCNIDYESKKHGECAKLLGMVKACRSWYDNSSKDKGIAMN